MENLFPNRRWLVIPVTVTSSINWGQVLETTPQSLRLSVDETETFVKYDVTVVTASYTQSWSDPISQTSGSYIVQAGVYGRPDIYNSSYPEYDYPGILTLLSTPAWTSGSIV
jgi:hypothetical protein